MSNSHVSAAFVITVTKPEAKNAQLAFAGAAMLEDRDGFDDAAIADELGSDFLTLFPPAPNDAALKGFIGIFEDADYFGLGCTIEAVAQDSESVDLWIAGHQIQVETVTRILQRCCPSALPFAFEWACYSDKLRGDEFGGGHAIITQNRIELVTTTDLMRRAIAREADEGADGFVLELATIRQLSYLNEAGTFGRLYEARVFDEREAAAFDLGPHRGQDVAWRAMPRPLGL